MKEFYWIFIVICSCLAINLKANTNTVDAKTDSLLMAYCDYYVSDIISTACYFEGYPYQFGGCSTDGFDCSGLLNYSVNEHELTLPRSSRDIARMGIYIGFDELIPGDFIFFKGRNLNSESVGHVAMVTHHHQNETYVIHATTHGVKEEVIQNNSYFMPRLLFCKRILPDLIRAPFLD